MKSNKLQPTLLSLSLALALGSTVCSNVVMAQNVTTIEQSASKNIAPVLKNNVLVAQNNQVVTAKNADAQEAAILPGIGADPDAVPDADDIAKAKASKNSLNKEFQAKTLTGEVVPLNASGNATQNVNANTEQGASIDGTTAQVEEHEPIMSVDSSYDFTEDTVVVGKDEVYTISHEGTTTLENVAALYELGLSNMIEANPGVDPILPVRGTSLIIPKQVILPNTPRNGIVVNSPEMRLYYYHDGKVDVLPIGIGQIGTDTPLDWVTKVHRKKANPTWTPTAAMHEEYKARGEFLPKVWPAGPDNPMGLFALYIGRLYAIHGTNADFGIGLRVSHGCVRLRNENIEYLFNTVPVGTRVQFINQAIKTAEDKDGNLYIEVHQPLSRNIEEFETFDKDLPFEFTKEQEEFFARPEVNQEVLKQALQERSGRVVLLNPAEF